MNHNKQHSIILRSDQYSLQMIHRFINSKLIYMALLLTRWVIKLSKEKFLFLDNVSFKIMIHSFFKQLNQNIPKNLFSDLFLIIEIEVY